MNNDNKSKVSAKDDMPLKKIFLIGDSIIITMTIVMMIIYYVIECRALPLFFTNTILKS